MATGNFYLVTSGGFGGLGHLQLLSYSISQVPSDNVSPVPPPAPPPTVTYQEVNDNDCIDFGIAAFPSRS